LLKDEKISLANIEFSR